MECPELLVTNIWAVSIGLRHNVISDIDTMFTGHAHITISDIAHFQIKLSVNNNYKVMVSEHGYTMFVLFMSRFKNLLYGKLSTLRV